MMPSSIKQGIVPCRGIADAFTPADFLPDVLFLIFAEATAARVLLLKQTIKRRARIGRAAGRRHQPIICQLWRRRRGQGIARHSDSRSKELAGVGLVFNRDPRRNRLGALKAHGRIEVHALFAAMQRGPALGTNALTFKIHVRGQCHPAAITSRGRYGLYKPRKLRPSNVDGRPWAGWSFAPA